MSQTAVSAVKEFQPPSIQNYNIQHPEYAHRFVDTRPGNKRGDRQSYWMNQGWEVAPYGNAGMQGNRPTGASSPDSAVHYKGMVLMRIKKPLAEARNKYWREKNKRLIEAAQVARRLSQLASQKGRGDENTSAFGRSVREQDRGGRRVTLHESEFDSRRDTQERILRDADPEALAELRERQEQMLEDQRKLEAENRRLREELAERAKRPSDRKRKIFPAS